MGTKVWALLTVDLGEKSSWTSHVASRDGRARLPLLVFFRGQRVSAMRDEALRVLTALYEAVAAVDPRWEVVPLFEFCGWSRQTIVERFNVDSFEEVRPECDQRELSPEWKSRLLPLCTVEPEVEGCSTSYSPMDEVCVGGTFDRLHAGHRLLLSATVAVCDKTIFVGITADVLLAKKKNRELLEPYGVRKGCVEDFIRAMNPNLKVAVGVLDDVSRAPMPKEFFIQVSLIFRIYLAKSVSPPPAGPASNPLVPECSLQATDTISRSPSLHMSQGCQRGAWLA